MLKEWNHNRGSPSAGREFNIQDILVCLDTGKFGWVWTYVCKERATVTQYKPLPIC